MGAFVFIGLTLALMLLGINLIGPFVINLYSQPILGISVDSTWLTLYFFVFATIYNAILLSIIVLHDGRVHSLEGEAKEHVFSLMIPCRNEETIIGQTLEALMKVDYPRDNFEVLVINDGSTDSTREIVHDFMKEYKQLKLLDIPIRDSGTGKGAALNKGFEYLLRTSPLRDSSNWVIGVFDSDGIANNKILKKASYSFKDPSVGAVQTLVRMSNPKESILTMLQDIEFVTFAKVTQSARTIFGGAVALGGNGQFVRASTLRTIALSPGKYWRDDALTEDLELGTRVLLSGWENSFLHTTSVFQNGVTTLSSLYKQRTRWSWGALQCFLEYAANLRVARSKMRIMKKFDLSYYLSAIMLPPLIFLVWALSILGLTGLFFITNPFPAYFMVANSISFFPVIGYGLWTVRHEYDAKLFIPLLFLTSAFTYHWVICTMRAMIHIAKRDKPQWMVTKKTRVDSNRIVTSRSRRHNLEHDYTSRGSESSTSGAGPLAEPLG